MYPHMNEIVNIATFSQRIVTSFERLTGFKISLGAIAIIHFILMMHNNHNYL